MEGGFIAARAWVFIDSDAGEWSCDFHFFSSFSEAIAEGLVGRKGARDIISVGRRVFGCAEWKCSYSWVKSYLCPNPREVVLQLETVEGIS